MDAGNLLTWIFVGAIAGWLAGLVVQGAGFGLIGDIVVGILGAFVAGWLLPRLGVSFGTSLFSAIVDAFVGAIVLLLTVRTVQRL